MNRSPLAFLVTCVVAAALFVSCDKEPQVVEDFMKCTVDGKAWSASSSVFGSVNQNLLVLNGVNLAGDTLRLLIQDQQTGTWPVKSTQNVTILKTAGKIYIPLNSADGFLTITKHDLGAKVIEGTFYLTLDGGQGDWKEVTGGSFKTTYN